ncbi:hypothetical protein G6011_03680 [Alternaria panax]|uniref:Uncharacterized protein n=1 Tax=Alternaria panax TaxID=48097 RepID=A0AAD4NU98_9PLEO|nr:hypothetical protein G6011_03680 [Alternaria panax]
MPPKARNAPVASPLKRGRPAREDAVVAAIEPPKKRGRPAKAKAEEPVVEDAPQPKKRGRQANIAPAPAPVVEAPAVKRGRGRPKKEARPAQEEAPVKSRTGRPPKADVTADVPPATPKRGRSTRTTALDLNRVAASPRIGKRSSPRTKAKAGPVARRLEPRMRSKLRTRLPPARLIKAEPVAKSAPTPTARRGRPPKNAAPAPVQAAVAKPTKPAKPLAPRKIRGHTMRQIPDRYVAQVDQYLHELIEADASPAQEEQAGEVEEAQEEDGVVVENAAGHVQDALVSAEQDRDQYQELGEDGGIDVNGQQDGAEDKEEDMHAAVAQQDGEEDEQVPEGANNDELPEETNQVHVFPKEDGENSEDGQNAEPVHQVEVNVQEDIEMEQENDGIVHAEVDTEIVVGEDEFDDGMDFLNGAEDGPVSGTPGPPAIAIFS